MSGPLNATPAPTTRTGNWPPRKNSLWLLALLLLQGCVLPPKPAPTPPKPADDRSFHLTPVPFSALPGWEKDDPRAALSAFQRSCEKILPMSDSAAMRPTETGGTAQAWKPACEAAARAGDPRAFFEQQFTPYRVSSDSKEQGLFTGYYEPEVEASLTPLPGYDVPLYPVPGDMLTVDLAAFDSSFGSRKLTARVDGKKVVPYFDRAAIDKGALNQESPVAWAKDPVETFFMEIQGSGRLKLPDGRLQRIGFAGQNGHKYVAIGGIMAQQGLLERASLSAQSIKGWLRANPDQAAAIMQQNPSYVFFRLVEGEGPIGAQGVALTPERSLAVDRSFIPLGAPVWVDTLTPWAAEGQSPFQKLMIAQDTGGAIKGQIRGDVYFGSGMDAGKLAGGMKSQGGYYLLLPKGLRP